MNLLSLLTGLDPWSLLIGALTMFFGFVTVVSLLLTVYYQRRNRRLYRERYTYSWADVVCGVQKMLNVAIRKRFNPDIIVSFSGAAGVVANLFLLLSERRIPFYQVMISEPSKPWQSEPSEYIAVETSRHTIYVPKALTLVAKDRRVILIDAVCVTGTNAYAMLSYLRKEGFTKLLYVSLLRVKPVHEIRCEPDFYFFENPTTEWYWPWGKGK